MKWIIAPFFIVFIITALNALLGYKHNLMEIMILLFLIQQDFKKRENDTKN